MWKLGAVKTVRGRRREAKSGERLTLESIDCELIVDALYRGVFDE